MPLQFSRQEFEVYGKRRGEAGKGAKFHSREGVELRSFRGSWSRSMLSEPDASRSGKSGLVSSAKRRYLKLVIGSVDLQNERRQGYE